MNEHVQRSESLTLVALPTAIGCARSFVISTLERWSAPLAVGDAVLLVEEMVTSAVRTTGVSDPTVTWQALDRLELISVSLLALRRSIGIEVWDADPYPSDQLSEDNSVDSPLLETLRVLAGRWGTIRSGRGKVVWAQLPVYERADSGLTIRPRTPTPRPRQPAPRLPDHELLRRVRDGLAGL